MKVLSSFLSLLLFITIPLYSQIGVSTVAGDGTSGFVDGVADSAQFDLPFGIYMDNSGDIYIGDDLNNRVRVISAGLVSTFAGSGAAGNLNGPALTAEFNRPFGITQDNAGNFYVCDGINTTIRKIDVNGLVSTFAGSTPGFADGLGTAAQFIQPLDIVIDASGNLYVTDANNHRIRKITPAGNVTTFAGSGVAGFADGNGAAAQFDSPWGLGIDQAGNLYIGDKNNYRVRKITPTGDVTTIAGSGTQGFLDGTALTAQFDFPSDVVIDDSGNFYITDYNNHRIRKLSIDGMVSTVAGTGIAGSLDGAALFAQFNTPSYLVIYEGNLFLTDRFNHQVRKITIRCIPTISMNGDTLTSSAGLDYQWFKDGLEILGATSMTHVTTMFGSYTVRVTDVTTCVGVSDPLIISGIHPVQKDRISIYPNPVKDRLRIEGSDLENYLILNTMGQLVKGGSLRTNSINVSGLIPGLYLLKLDLHSYRFAKE